MFKNGVIPRKGGFNGKGLILVIFIIESAISVSCGYHVSLVSTYLSAVNADQHKKEGVT